LTRIRVSLFFLDAIPEGNAIGDRDTFGKAKETLARSTPDQRPALFTVARACASPSA
jgi:hypothetical protein